MPKKLLYKKEITCCYNQIPEQIVFQIKNYKGFLLLSLINFLALKVLFIGDRENDDYTRDEYNQLKAEKGIIDINT